MHSSFYGKGNALYEIHSETETHLFEIRITICVQGQLKLRFDINKSDVN